MLVRRFLSVATVLWLVLSAHILPGGGQKTNALLAEVEAAMKATTQSSLYTSKASITATFLPQDFVLDGEVSKQVWRGTEWVEFEHDMSGQRQFPEALTRVAALWTPKHLYFAFWCKYATLNIYSGEDVTKERWELWDRDVAEVFINPEPQRVNHYYEFEVAPNNQWIDLEIDKDKTPFNDASWDSGFEHATHIDAKKHVWTCEMRIPVASMGVKDVKPGSEWRVNFFRADGPGDDTKRRFMSWSTIPEGKTFHVPTRFGLIRFVE